MWKLELNFQSISNLQDTLEFFGRKNNLIQPQENVGAIWVFEEKSCWRIFVWI